MRTRDVGVDTPLSHTLDRDGISFGPLRQPQLLADREQILLGEAARTGHQLDMCIPELVGGRGLLDQVGGAARQFTAADRAMAENITHAVAQLSADFRDPRIGSTAVRTVVTAVFHQRDGGAFGADDVVAGGIDGPIEAVTHGFRTNKGWGMGLALRIPSREVVRNVLCIVNPKGILPRDAGGAIGRWCRAEARA